MAMIHCSECGKEISDKAKSCPGCGAEVGKVETKSNKKIDFITGVGLGFAGIEGIRFIKWLLGGIALVIVSIVIIIAVSNVVKNATDDIDNTLSDITENIENELSDDFEIEITRQYKDSSFSYYIEGTLKNNKDKDYSYLQIEFICYDKDGNNLGSALDNTNNLLGNQSWKFKAMALSDVSNIDHCDYHSATGW